MGLTRLCGVVVFIIATIACSALAIHRGLSAGRTLALLMLGGMLSLLTALLIFPMALTPDGITYDPVPGFYPLPFSLISFLLQEYGVSSAFRLLLSNAVLYVPVGFFGFLLQAPSVSSKFRRTLLYLGIPLAIEFGRLLECLFVSSFYKTVALDSIILAVLGISIGISCGRLIYNSMKSLRRRTAFGGRRHQRNSFI